MPVMRWLIPWEANTVAAPRLYLRWRWEFWASGADATRTLLALLMSPCLMGLVAAGLGQYPYGGAPRLTQYLAPSICLLAGVGASVVVARLSPGIRRRQALALGIVLLAAIGVFLAVRDLCEPYRVRGDLETRQFARAFWQQNTREVDLVCVKSDLGLNFQPHLWSRGMSAVYLFYRGMFAQPRMRNYRVETWIGGMVARPARLVFYDDLPEDEPAFKHWLAWLGRSYSIAPRRDYTVNPGKPGELWLRDRYVVLDLVPRELDGDRMARRAKSFGGSSLGKMFIETMIVEGRRLDIDLAKKRQAR